LGSLGIPILLMLGLGIAFLLTYQEAILDFRKAIGGIESNTILYDRNGQQFHSFHRGENRLVVSLQQISRPLQLSVLAAEDTRFFQHRGVDTRRILSALWTDLLEGGWRC
jgi:membrane peptidoglycan carboxypeptidase